MQLEQQLTLRQRFVRNRNIISKSITTIIFATFMWHGKFQQLQGVPATYNYYVVQHAFDSGLLVLIILLALLGFYVSFSKRHLARLKKVFLISGFAVWCIYGVLFLYRDILFPHPPSLQSMLVVSITISFWIDLIAGDF